MADADSKQLVENAIASVDSLITDYNRVKKDLAAKSKELVEVRIRLAKTEKRVTYLKKKLLDDHGFTVKDESDSLVEILEQLLPMNVIQTNTEPNENVTSGSFPSGEINSLLTKMEDVTLEGMFSGKL